MLDSENQSQVFVAVHSMVDGWVGRKYQIHGFIYTVLIRSLCFFQGDNTPMWETVYLVLRTK